MIKDQMTVMSHSNVATNIYEMVLAGELVKLISNPGQFIHIRVRNDVSPLLRRPISIASVEKQNNQITILYRAEGKGTKQLANIQVGETVDVIGPLGNGFPTDELKTGQRALLVGGGIGVPPLYELSKQLTKQGIEVHHVLGFQSAEQAFYLEQFNEIAPTFIATADGSIGTAGFVTDFLASDDWTFDCIYACGPTAMLKALQEKYKHIRGFVSLENRMACGIGACFACVCHLADDPDGSTYRKICSDGPVFEMGAVVL
ncbi:dihydroorotate dehydrogenase electron transfer subunit [Heyndrickxia ginsengihumi]|uniref:Dihydroorotate dehydrogenase B (NAD(+)), electron transfer subunit n=1 Tax=Heyndrickxia ginsengihumi TaxID=363870 RepID=A0A0A6VF40_9BACI|nr:dihydroorotate dehydrogenase electron transfer subunit [Heyndrickxia ginsengihumi]KHD86196.1 dihydroorotate dehydrogenase [Heyndrickxia ginsengihumi]MBE6183447.1 dihydroorotate dehydrogenase electron transfer subunit [Bacillus sp. (in: firmicutes)]MCM3022430.1 dihydroorotate dehydrogenase electron transfer subunit [Heyndrickxia ginsengihumi]NEY18629.1 dihydroorotate dehydrogenase electron transfer subunit [Heyndrickxia ginsengihumi]